MNSLHGGFFVTELSTRKLLLADLSGDLFVAELSTGDLFAAELST